MHIVQCIIKDKVRLGAGNWNQEYGAFKVGVLNFKILNF